MEVRASHSLTNYCNCNQLIDQTAALQKKIYTRQDFVADKATLANVNKKHLYKHEKVKKELYMNFLIINLNFCLSLIYTSESGFLQTRIVIFKSQSSSSFNELDYLFDTDIHICLGVIEYLNVKDCLVVMSTRFCERLIETVIFQE